MAFTFSRRDFMKYTALAAAAVAVSGSLTGCANPNQPSTVYNGSDASLSFGGSSGIFGIGGVSDKHTLKAVASDKTTKTGYSDKTLTCVFQHAPISDGTSCAASHYQLRIVKTDKSVRYVTASSTAITGFNASNGGVIKKGDDVENIITVAGLNLTDVAELHIQYYPRNNALGNETDTYSDVFATWNITSLIATK